MLKYLLIKWISLKIFWRYLRDYCKAVYRYQKTAWYLKNYKGNARTLGELIKENDSK